MMKPMAPLIEVLDLAVVYRLQRDPTASVQEFTIRLLKRQVRYEDLWALRDVSFRLERGAVLGIVGANGAGKSTLLKAVARVLPPTAGRIVVRGRVAPLIELGAGFHLDMTGYENLLLYGTILGHDPRDLRRDANAIAEWAEVQEFMDVPVRSFSSGMLARLGFAVATWNRPDVLVVDEVLSVGDARFQERSMDRIHNLLAAGTAVLFVSHSEKTIRTIAQDVLWLDHGRVAMLGDAGTVMDAYLEAEGIAPRTEGFSPAAR
jgi:ABC-type polysaccharide/polyol phosphate transport system ATPase subunit